MLQMAVEGRGETSRLLGVGMRLHDHEISLITIIIVSPASVSVIMRIFPISVMSISSIARKASLRMTPPSI